MTPDSSPAARPTRPVSRVVLLVTLLLAISAFQVAAVMITPALPKIGPKLGASASQISLSQALFFALGGLSAAALPVSDRFGRKRMLTVVLALGIVGSVLVATSGNLALFDLGRWLQATGVVALPLSFLILRDQVPAEEYPLYLGWLNALNSGVSGIDVFIAGRVTDTVGYRGIFWIATGLGAVALVCVLAFVPRSQAISQRTDWLGIATLGAGVVAVSTGLAQSGTWGWTDAGTVLLLVAGVALIAAFVVVERVSAHPMVQVGLLASRRVWGLAVIILFGMAGFMGATNMLMPFWAELPKAVGGFGLSATDYSLAVLPGTFLTVCFAPTMGHLARRVGWRPILITATAVAGAGLVGLALCMDSTVPAFVFATLVTCVFAGAAMTAATGLGVLFSPPETPAFLPGIVSVMFSFGSSLGFAISGSVLARDTVSVPGAPPLPTQDAFTHAFALMAAFMVLAAVLTLVVPRIRSQAHAPARTGTGTGTAPDVQTAEA
ncbi:MFS transporter [Yinghuangia seranimata]|uniref:MFS transporter n=1 Tax=Yinghuangia seranimata TaxID=408067 RepID=UPI00248CC23B|nr:MFS transporter [Yinghuangia seranimata]MDI2130112.1 MFS transporter [Yinghuangia seranimata]